MERLSGLDASFLYSESRSVLMHTLKIAVCDLPDGQEDLQYEHFREVLVRHLPQLPAFTLRVREVPFSLGHPVWVTDPDFDVNKHIKRASLPAPGSSRELDETIAWIATQPLPRDRPLWEIWMLDRLEGGGIAFVSKIHHSVADGLASAAMLSNLSRPVVEKNAATVGEHLEKLPDDVTMLRNAMTAFPGRAVRFPGLLARTITNGARAAYTAARSEDTSARPFQTVQTRFNRTISPHRSFATVEIPIARILGIKKRYGVTVNDTVLAVVGRAVAEFLTSAGECPEKSLLATVPVGIGGVASDPNRLQGNKLSNVFTSLATNLGTPEERLKAVHSSMNAAKSFNRALGPEVMHQWAEYIPPLPFKAGFRAVSATRLMDRVRPAANLIVSNVRGPSQPVMLAGVKMRKFFSVGPLLDGLGLNVTAWSYHTHMSFSVLADQDALIDAHLMTEAITASVAWFEQ